MRILILPGLAVLAVGCLTTRHWVKRHGFWVLLFRFLSGHALDGQYRTNAGWITRATRVLHNSGHAIWWHHLPRMHRAGIRTGGIALIILITYGLAVATFVTVLSLFAVLAVKVFHNVSRRLAPILCPFWFWFSGRAMDGRDYTGRTRWQRLPRPHRAGHRTGGTALAVVIVYGLAVATFATVLSLFAVAAAVVTFCAWHGVHMIRTWQHERHNVRPLERTLMRGIPERPVSLEVNLERDSGSDADVITGVVVEWPPGTEIREPEKQYALEAVTTRLPIEAPDAKWELKGRARLVTFTPSEPPPFPVSWEDVEAAVRRAAFNELVFGIGKRGEIVTAKYSESPHIAIPGGSGGGKSNLVAFLLLQELMRGSLIINLDPKWISQLWLQGLPNVINAHDAPSLHLALCWLGKELDRRVRTAYYSANGTGRVHGSVGDRIIADCEELNYGMPGLKDYYAELRAKDKSLPKRSPAIAGLSGMSCAGRASDMHEFLVAQLLSVESTGVRDSTIRTNAGAKAMFRHDRPGWDMAVGKHVPMPQPSTIPGRIHVVTADGVRETQVPYLHLVPEDEDDPQECAIADKAVAWARELAVSGTVAKIPIGGEYGVPEELLPPVVRQGCLALNAGQGSATGTTGAAVAPPGPELPPAMTIREAVEAGVFGDLTMGAARRRIQRAGLAGTGERRGRGDKEYLLADLHAAAKGDPK